MTLLDPSIEILPAEMELLPTLIRGPFARQRRRMLIENLWGRDVRDPRVLRVMIRVAREQFIPEAAWPAAYDDGPLEIGHQQTISQPYLVARMSELAGIVPGSRVLEISAGSGYQTAVLMELGAWVYGLEIVEELALATRARLLRLGYLRFAIHVRDGFEGLPEAGPFDLILLAAAPERVPPPLLEQLVPGGRLIAPIGPPKDQRLYRFTRGPEGIESESLFAVRFVPMTGRADELAE